jgi:hypothetical protein
LYSGSQISISNLQLFSEHVRTKKGTKSSSFSLNNEVHTLPENWVHVVFDHFVSRGNKIFYHLYQKPVNLYENGKSEGEKRRGEKRREEEKKREGRVRYCIPLGGLLSLFSKKIGIPNHFRVGKG